MSVTPGYLADTLRAATGMRASGFIHHRIVLEAKRLLAYTEQSIAEIGFGLGFADPSYFARFFRRESGMTPTAFRHKSREKYQTLRD